MKVAGTVGVVLVLATSAQADGPDTSLRPVLRGGNLAAQSGQLVIPATPAPQIIKQAQAADAQLQETIPERRGLFKSLRPLFRSRKVEKTARENRKRLAQGAVCGDLAIQGEAVGRVKGRLKGCGLADAVRVRSVSGVALSTGAVMDCTTANALKSWMERSAKPAWARKGGGLQGIKVAAHYACRTRNNQKGAKISEHGRGRAIDISGFRLKDGAEVSVLKGWHTRSYSAAMRKVHAGACGPFGTVLGPNANRFHRDHFHFDTARYRSGSYCR